MGKNKTKMQTNTTTSIDTPVAINSNNDQTQLVFTLTADVPFHIHDSLVKEYKRLKQEYDALVKQSIDYKLDISNLTRKTNLITDDNDRLHIDIENLKAENKDLKERLNKLEKKDETISVREIMMQLEEYMCAKMCKGTEQLAKTFRRIHKLAKKDKEFNEKVQNVLDNIDDDIIKLIEKHRKTGNNIVHGNRSGVISKDQIRKEIYDDNISKEKNDIIFNELIELFETYDMIENDMIVFE